MSKADSVPDNDSQPASPQRIQHPSQRKRTGTGASKFMSVDTPGETQALAGVRMLLFSTATGASEQPSRPAGSRRMVHLIARGVRRGQAGRASACSGLPRVQASMHSVPQRATARPAHRSRTPPQLYKRCWCRSTAPGPPPRWPARTCRARASRGTRSRRRQSPGPAQMVRVAMRRRTGIRAVSTRPLAIADAGARRRRQCSRAAPSKARTCTSVYSMRAGKVFLVMGKPAAKGGIKGAGVASACQAWCCAPRAAPGPLTHRAAGSTGGGGGVHPT